MWPNDRRFVGMRIKPGPWESRNQKQGTDKPKLTERQLKKKVKKFKLET